MLLLTLKDNANRASVTSPVQCQGEVVKTATQSLVGVSVNKESQVTIVIAVLMECGTLMEGEVVKDVTVIILVH
jgi:hypothetical protein